MVVFHIPPSSYPLIGDSWFYHIVMSPAIAHVTAQSCASGLVPTAMTKLISDYAKVEISNKVKDILRMYHISSWNSEPCHQSQNPAEGRYCTLKSWTNTIMNRTGAPADCWLLCMIHASYILNHLSCDALNGNIPLGMLYGVFQTSASFSCTPSTNQYFMPPTTNPTPLLVKKGLHVELALENMLLMRSPTNFLMMTPKQSSTGLLSD